MIGEIRDTETAEIAIRASMTGHLVFSTLHTSGSIQALARLSDMKIDSASFSSGVSCVINQRLVRNLCSCKTERKLNNTEKKDLSPELVKKLDTQNLAFPQGCDKCLNTGYKGRTGVFEILFIDRGLRDLISEKAGESKLRQYCSEHLLKKDLKSNALEKVLDRTIGIDEFLRVFGDNFDVPL
jgi:type II secretory ATPase GspE/PulE/Tfp pilus assembly ATPase PilB-like protein